MPPINPSAIARKDGVTSSEKASLRRPGVGRLERLEDVDLFPVSQTAADAPRRKPFEPHKSSDKEGATRSPETGWTFSSEYKPLPEKNISEEIAVLRSQNLVSRNGLALRKSARRLLAEINTLLANPLEQQLTLGGNQVLDPTSVNDSDALDKRDTLHASPPIQYPSSVDDVGTVDNIDTFHARPQGLAPSSLDDVDSLDDTEILQASPCIPVPYSLDNESTLDDFDSLCASSRVLGSSSVDDVDALDDLETLQASPQIQAQSSVDEVGALDDVERFLVDPQIVSPPAADSCDTLDELDTLDDLHASPSEHQLDHGTCQVFDLTVDDIDIPRSPRASQDLAPNPVDNVQILDDLDTLHTGPSEQIDYGGCQVFDLTVDDTDTPRSSHANPQDLAPNFVDHVNTLDDLDTLHSGPSEQIDYDVCQNFNLTVDDNDTLVSSHARPRVPAPNLVNDVDTQDGFDTFLASLQDPAPSSVDDIATLGVLDTLHASPSEQQVGHGAHQVFSQIVHDIELLYASPSKQSRSYGVKKVSDEARNGSVSWKEDRASSIVEKPFLTNAQVPKKSAIEASSVSCASRIAARTEVMSDVLKIPIPHQSSCSGLLLFWTYALATFFALCCPEPQFTRRRLNVRQFEMDVEICGKHGSRMTVVIADAGLCVECEAADEFDASVEESLDRECMSDFSRFGHSLEDDGQANERSRNPYAGSHVPPEKQRTVFETVVTGSFLSFILTTVCSSLHGFRASPSSTIRHW